MDTNFLGAFALGFAIAFLIAVGVGIKVYTHKIRNPKCCPHCGISGDDFKGSWVTRAGAGAGSKKKPVTSLQCEACKKPIMKNVKWAVLGY